ncbi:MAG TPA: GTP cyclohydrolase II [Lichenihabitans sp.]|nr:GTP cyclohydrolase II [Lichenihabitans sp.]
MSRIETAVEALARGGIAVLIDEALPAAGHLMVAADAADRATWRTIARHGRGAPALVFGATSEGHAALPENADAVVTQQPAEGLTEADLAARRAEVGRAAAAGRIEAGGAGRLGLVLRAATPHGVFGRAAADEAAVDGLALAGRAPVAAMVPLAVSGGLLARDDAAESFARDEGLPCFSVQDVVAHRLCHETIVEHAATARLPSAYAERPLEVEAFRSLVDGSEHLAMVHRPLGRSPLVRLHSECLTGDALGSLRCDCGDQLRRSLQLVADHAEGGAVLYLRGHEGRGIGLANKIRAYALQDLGRDTVEANADLGFDADLRDYGLAVQVLRLLGIDALKLLTNNPRKAAALERYGIAVRERVPLRIGPNPHNAAYLDTKRRKLDHDLASRPAQDRAVRGIATKTGN